MSMHDYDFLHIDDVALSRLSNLVEVEELNLYVDANTIIDIGITHLCKLANLVKQVSSCSKRSHLSIIHNMNNISQDKLVARKYIFQLHPGAWEESPGKTCPHTYSEILHKLFVCVDKPIPFTFGCGYLNNLKRDMKNHKTNNDMRTFVNFFPREVGSNHFC